MIHSFLFLVSEVSYTVFVLFILLHFYYKSGITCTSDHHTYGGTRVHQAQLASRTSIGWQPHTK